MSVTEIKQALGSWELRLREDTPQAVRDALTFYGHIAILPGELPATQYTDALLSAARYVGVLRGRDAQDDFVLKGSGLTFWLGDEDDKGDIFETAVNLNAATFGTAIAALLPAGGAVVAGTIYSVPGTYTGTHRWETPRKALTYVTDVFGAEFRVNNDATLDAGTVAQLYVTTPKTLLIPKGAGADLFRKALPGKMAMGTDVEDTTTRVVLLAEGEGDAISTAAVNAPATPYKDLRGNALKATRLVSESGTETSNAPARAQLMLNRFLNPRKAVNLSTNDYDVKGSFVVGDYLDVYDPENGFYDLAREVYWQGERLNPMALRCVEMSWPIEAGFTVAFRDINGVWIDLTNYFVPESGETTIVVGELARGMASVGGESVGSRPNLPEGPGADGTIPAAPAFIDYSTGVYQEGRRTLSAVRLEWNQPLNTDASTITDGGRYEIRWRPAVVIGYNVSWDDLTTYSWDDLGTWDALLSDPIQATTQWTYATVGWDTRVFTVMGLGPGVQYEFQVRAVDAANPPHFGAWSSTVTIITTGDIIAPSAPAAPTVASSLIGIMVVHKLGKASGGEFNLEPDMDHLEVHVGGTAEFVPSDATKIGAMPANQGLILGSIPVVGSFKVESADMVWVKVVAVDQTGNRSAPSAGAQSTIQLIDSAHISDLTVSKVSAGTITAAWLLAGSIKTADAGARVELDSTGFRAYNDGGARTAVIDSETGDVEITGRFATGLGNGEVLIEGGFGAGFIIFDAPSNVPEEPDFAVFLWGKDHPAYGGQQLAIQTVEGKNIGTGAETGTEVNVGVNALELLHRDVWQANMYASLNLGMYPSATDPSNKGMIHFQGARGRNAHPSIMSTHFTGWTSITNGVVGVTWNYGSTSPYSNVILTSAQADVNCWCSGSNATSFTVSTNPSNLLRNVHYDVIGTKDII